MNAGKDTYLVGIGYGGNLRRWPKVIEIIGDATWVTVGMNITQTVATLGRAAGRVRQVTREGDECGVTSDLYDISVERKAASH